MQRGFFGFEILFFKVKTITKNRGKTPILLAIPSGSEMVHQSRYVCIVYCLDMFLGFYRQAFESNYSYNMGPKENSWISRDGLVVKSVGSGVRLPGLEFQLVTLSVWLWGNFLTSLCFTVPFVKRGKTVPAAL